jgi:ankyrin repeat protein
MIVKYPQDVNASGGFYVRPLVAALAGKHFQTAELLRLSGADPNVQCYKGNTPLHSVAWDGDVEVVQVLLDLEADVNIWNNEGWSPFCYIFANRPKNLNFLPLANAARLLLDHGADIKTRNDKGGTPLHTTTSSGWVEAVRLLLERGADVGAKDEEGRTPFSIAKEYGYDDIMKLLTEYGAQ